MCNITGIVFGATTLDKKEIEGKRVIEVGSYDINGSLRPILESWKPSQYIGVDIFSGPGVDIVCKAEDLIEKFGKEEFDVVIATELIEHTKNWKEVISNIKNICKKNGIIIVTTRSKGFKYHAHPYDFWRYEIKDMKNIFSDCDIIKLKSDPSEPGVFIKVKKTNKFVEKNLDNYELYSIVANRRLNKVNKKDFYNIHFLHLILKEKIKQSILKIGRGLFSKI